MNIPRSLVPLLLAECVWTEYLTPAWVPLTGTRGLSPAPPRQSLCAGAALRKYLGPICIQFMFLLSTRHHHQSLAIQNVKWAALHRFGHGCRRYCLSILTGYRRRQERNEPLFRFKPTSIRCTITCVSLYCYVMFDG